MSEIKVNKISPRTNCGTVQLGDSGDTITIPAGASITNSGTASGFGATGAVSWNTTVKTSGFTAVNGEGYFVDTTSGAISVNLPAGTAGAVVGFKDYANTFDTNNLTLVQNGSDKIGGSAENAILATEGLAVTLIFVDSTQGWLVTDSGLQSEAPAPSFIVATGGTVTTVCTNFKVHTFTGPGTFCVSAGGNAAGSNSVDYLVIAGGGSGGGGYSFHTGTTGGGGAGGYRESSGTTTSYTASPLGACVSALPVSVQGYPITVGGGASGVGGASPFATGNGAKGSDSVFSTITSTAGGGGRGGTNCGANPGSCVTTSPGDAIFNQTSGGSGGGGNYFVQTPGNPRGNNAGGDGNTPPVSPSQGNYGGLGLSGSSAPQYASGGGGGAGAVGVDGTTNNSGAGGAGATSSINGTPTVRAGGGGGAGSPTPITYAPGGTGGGGAGGYPSACATNGTVNTGSGGGAARPAITGCTTNGNVSGAGGSGIVIIRYKFQ
jgi:hypothetical protein